jgi:hypothetical protein
MQSEAIALWAVQNERGLRREQPEAASCRDLGRTARPKSRGDSNQESGIGLRIGCIVIVDPHFPPPDSRSLVCTPDQNGKITSMTC